MIYYKQNKLNELKRWHKWFAWYPVTVNITPDGDNKKVWLKHVQRCLEPYQRHVGHGCHIVGHAKKYKEF